MGEAHGSVVANQRDFHIKRFKIFNNHFQSRPTTPVRQSGGTHTSTFHIANGASFGKRSSRPQKQSSIVGGIRFARKSLQWMSFFFFSVQGFFSRKRDTLRGTIMLRDRQKGVKQNKNGSAAVSRTSERANGQEKEQPTTINPPEATNNGHERMS